MRVLLAWLLVCVVSGLDPGFVRRLVERPHAAVLCCCGPRGVENGCTCTGPCCAHAGHERAPAGAAALDDHCGARAAGDPVPAPGLALAPLPAPVRVVAPRSPRARLVSTAAARRARGPASPAEPPPRRGAC